MKTEAALDRISNDQLAPFVLLRELGNQAEAVLKNHIRTN